jgi:hemoglobin
MLDPEKSLSTSQSLYSRLGSYDGIARFVRELMPRLHGDPQLGVYWKGKSLDSRRRGDKLLTDFLCAAFEGPVQYFGPDMKTAHEGLGISEDEWDLTLAHIAATLDAVGIAESDKTEFMECAAGLKTQIVEAPPPAAQR